MTDLSPARFQPLTVGMCRAGRVWIYVVAASLLLISDAVAAPVQQLEALKATEKADEQSPVSDDQFINDVCKRIGMAARMWTLPPAFLARLIWKESRFDPGAVSPVGAQGIAQFMPATARLRNLDDPFDLKHAIPASAHYLSDLRNRFGSLGLAAAAYNGGPNRVEDWRAGVSGLPSETWNYVIAITGFSPNEWKEGRPDSDLDEEPAFLESCRKLHIRPSSLEPRYATAGWQPWGAQLAADWSASRALSRYAWLQRQYPEVLSGQTPMVLRVINYRFGRAPRFAIRIGQPDRSMATRFCQRLQSYGGACLVTRTERQR